MSKPIQKFSPRWLELALEQVRQSSLSKFVACTENQFAQHALNLFVAIGFFLFAIFFRQILNAWNMGYGPNDFPMIIHILDHAEMLAIAFAFGSLAPYFSVQRLPWLHLLGFGVGLVACYVYLPSLTKGATPEAMTWNYLAAFGIFLAIFVAGRLTMRRYLFKGEAFVGSGLTLYLGYLVNYLYWFNTAVIDFPRMIFPFSFLSLEAQAKKRSSSLIEWAYIFSPTILFTPLPIEAKDRVFTHNWNERVRGLQDFLVGFLFLFLSFKLRQNWIQMPAQAVSIDLLIYGFCYYIYYFLASYAWMALPFGLLRWYGMKLPDFFDYPLLATSPADRWRRWNTYYYHWFYKVVFFPLFKKTKSVALCIAVVFFLTFIFHAGRLAYGPLFLNNQLLRHPLTIQLGLFFAGHALLVYLGFKFPKLWPAPENRSAWWGVALMALLMSCVHLFAV